MSTEKSLHSPGVSRVDPGVCEIRFRDDGILNVSESQTESAEDRTSRCSCMTLVLGSASFGFQSFNKNSDPFMCRGCKMCLLLVRLYKRPNKIH